MGSDWLPTTIGDQLTLQRGVDITRAEQRVGKFPVISSGGISSFHDTAAAKGPGVVLGRKGVVGSVWYSPDDYWPHDTTLWVKDFKGNDPRFVYYFFKDRSRDLARLDVGSANPTLNRNHVHPIAVLWPSLSIQREIAHALGALDDKIELNRQMNDTLEAMARALFKSWFVDFDPVHAKVAGRAPMGMDAETAKIFPSEFVDSDLGPVPKGWRTQPLGELVSALSGGTPSKGNKELWGGGIPWISPKSMTAIHADEAEDFVQADAVGNGTRIAPSGSTLVMVRGMGLHQCVRVSQARGDVTFNQDVKALVGRAIDPVLLLFALLNSQGELLSRVESSGHGTGKLPSEILLGHRITMPPFEHQARLAWFFESLNDRIAASRQESRTLASLRDELLPRLLSGALSLPDTQTHVEVVA